MSKYRLLASALAAVMLFTFVGCSGREQTASFPTAGPEEGAIETASETEAAVTPVPTPEPTPEPTVYAGELTRISVARSVYDGAAEPNEVTEESISVPYVAFPPDEIPEPDEMTAGIDAQQEYKYSIPEYMAHVNREMATAPDVNGYLFIDSYIEKTVGGYGNTQTLWHYETDRMCISSAREMNDGVLAIGSLPYDNADIIAADPPGNGEIHVGGIEYGGEILGAYDGPLRTEYVPTLMKLTKDGEPVWTCSLEAPGMEWRFQNFCEHADGSITVFFMQFEENDDRSVEKMYLGACGIDASGSLLWSQMAEAERYYTFNTVIGIDGGYLAVCSEYRPGYWNPDLDCVLRLDEKGRMLEKLSFTTADEKLTLTDLAPCGQYFAVSGWYKFPLQAAIELEQSGVTEMSREQFTPLMQQNSSAVLILLDVNDLAPCFVYEIEGADGKYHNGLETGEDGGLEWHIGAICSSQYNYGSSGVGPMINLSKKYIYRFDPSAELAGIEYTGRIG